jgi:N-hydroxyarylamine O-acetyltransferase
MFDLSAYLARIGLPARPTVDDAGLLALQRAHRLAIPFENLDIALGRPIAIDGDRVFTKLVERRRGGYCFEQNRLFRDALAALDFTVRPLLARTWLLARDTPPKTHTVNLVTVGEQEWIADAGFGGSYAPPMPLIDGAEATAPDGARFRLVREADWGWMLWRAGDPLATDGRTESSEWERQYSFTTAAVAEADLLLANHWTSTAPGTRFTTHRIVGIALPTGYASLTDRHYRRRTASDSVSAELTDPRVYRLRLSLVFGIDLTAEEAAALF